MRVTKTDLALRGEVKAGLIVLREQRDTLSQQNDARNHDNSDNQEFGCCEEVLHSVGQLHTQTVDECNYY